MMELLFFFAGGMFLVGLLVSPTLRYRTAVVIDLSFKLLGWVLLFCIIVFFAMLDGTQ